MPRMTRLLILTSLGVLAVCVLLTAQEAPKPATAAKGTITMTGCLQAGTAPDTFLLSHVTQTSSTSSATGTSGSATATASAASGDKTTGTKYELVVEGNVNLKPHVGHKVEVTGTHTMKEATGTTGAAPAASAATGTAAAKKFTVTAVKHVAATCP